MPIHIAIPEPTSSDQDYNQRTLPQYISALQSAGAVPVLIPLNESKDRVAELLAGVQGILLPGSLFDVDPHMYREERIPECGDSDPDRGAMDELLLQDAFNLRKPVLAICAGVQSLNVWRNGSLIQHLQTPVDHSPGRAVAEAHPVEIAPGSRLASLLENDETAEEKVNSSHHQAIRIAGDSLRVVAVSPVDGVVEGVELDSADHFVVGVQWHPERTYAQSSFSRSIFAAFLSAALEFESGNAESPVVQNG
jgi:putative glutamine amidotransferase